MTPDENDDSADKQKRPIQWYDLWHSRDGVGFAIALGLLWMFGLWFVMSF